MIQAKEARRTPISGPRHRITLFYLRVSGVGVTWAKLLASEAQWRDGPGL
jgi:hypothetical protein